MLAHGMIALWKNRMHLPKICNFVEYPDKPRVGHLELNVIVSLEAVQLDTWYRRLYGDYFGADCTRPVQLNGSASAIKSVWHCERRNGFTNRSREYIDHHERLRTSLSRSDMPMSSDWIWRSDASALRRASPM